MKIDFMRKIDYFLGIPLTFCVTRYIKLAALFRKQCKPRKILFIELSEMGSTIIADPAMKKAKNDLKSEIYFVIFAKNKPSLDLMGTVRGDHIFTIRESSLLKFIIDVVKFFIWCRSHKIDTVIDLELFSRVTALLSGISGAVNRVGFYGFHAEGLYRGDILTHKVSYNAYQHMGKNFISLVNALLSPSKELPYSKKLICDGENVLTDKPTFSENEFAAIRKIIKQHFSEYSEELHEIVIINPNASDMLPQRRWPTENFIEVINQLLAEYSNIIVLVTGSVDEYLGIDSICRIVNNKRCINFSGALKFKQLPHLYAQAKLMLTNDSGPAHFAAVTELPTYVLFGPETPLLYSSLGNCIPIYAGISCSPCVSAANHRKTPCKDNQCLKIILPKQVVALLSKNLTL